MKQFHGFCDSSQEAYCAVVYIRIQNSVGISVDLLTASYSVKKVNYTAIGASVVSSAC